MTVTYSPSWFMVISAPNCLTNNKIVTKKLTCHQRITLKQLTQFNTWDYLSKFFLFLKLIQIWRGTKDKSVDPNWWSLCPTFDALTVLFINTWILKFKSQLMFAFFAAANHLSRPLRKQKATPAGSKDHGLWFVIGRFWSVFCVSLFQGLLLVIVIMIDGSQKCICDGCF